MTTQEIQTGVFVENTPGAPCPDGFVCLYRDGNLEGPSLRVQAGIAIRNLIPLGWNDAMSSWHNNNNTRYCWYFDVEFQGEHHPMEPGFKVTVPPREDNKASSLQPC
jgi:hypothetical protein